MMDDHDIIADDVDQLIRLLLSSIYTHEKTNKNRMEWLFASQQTGSLELFGIHKI
jgi:hypothetical protein